MTYRRLVALTLAGMGLFVLVVVLAVLGLARSERFTLWLFDTVEARAAGIVRFSGVSGTFAGELRIARVDALLDAGALSLADARVRLDLSGLVARALIVDELSIARVELDATAARAAPTSSSAPTSLPVLMLLRNVSLGSVSLTTVDGTQTLSDTELGVRYVDGLLELSDISTRWQEFAVDASASVELGDVVTLDANGCARGTLEGERIAGCLRVGGAYPALTVTAQTSAPFVASADGAVTLGAAPSVDLALGWRNAAIGRVPDLSSPRASLRVSGPLDQLRIRGDGIAVYQERELPLELAVVRRADAIVVEALSIAIGDGEVELTGEIAGDFSGAALTIAGRHIDPSLFHPDWPGDLELLGELTAYAGTPATLQLDDLTIGGELRGYPVAAAGGLDVRGDTVTLRDVLLLSRVDQVALAGTVGAAAIDLAVRAGIRDLAAWWPELEGELDANLTIRGSIAAPRASGDLMLRNARFMDNRIGRLALSGQGGLGESDAMDFIVGLAGLEVGGYSVDAIDAEISGTLSEHSARIRARADQWSLTGRARGGLAGGEWRGEIDALEIDPTSFDNWALERPSSIAVGRGSVQVEDACLVHMESRLCVALTRIGGPLDFLRIDASEFDVEILSPLLPVGLDVSGVLDSRIEITNLAERPNGRILIDGRGGAVHTEITAGAEIDLPFEQFNVDATIADGRLAMRGEFATPEFARGTLDVTIDRVQDADSPLNADVEFVWLNPAALTVLSPDVGDVMGTIYVDVGVTGRRDAPVFAGEVRLEDGSIEVPVWGLLVERISGRATLTRDDQVAYSAEGFIDDAALAIEGQSELDAARGFPTTLRLRGEAIRLVQLSDVEVFVSPDLSAAIALPNIAVTGRVDVPRARISAVALSEQAVTPSRDTIVHGREEAEPERPLAVTADLTVNLGDDIRYQDGKIDAQVMGSLEVTYQSDLGATAVGALVLSGEYDAYGNPLTLEQSRLIFAGPWGNPSLDVRAVRRIDEITVGVQLTGTLEQPVTRIFSDPAMSETNALSYLLFGRPLDNTGDQNTAALENAALSMGLRQALPAIERIGETLRLDEFAIRGTATDAGALMAGKYLSPNLYIRYSYGLFNRIGGLLLRYRINERLSLETLSGEQKSMDLLYTVEKE